MKLQKVDAGVWVDVNDELPDKQDGHIVKTSSGKTYKTDYSTSYKGGWERLLVLQADTITYWLKPLKQVYVLTEDELKYFYALAALEGMTSEALKLKPKRFLQFLQSITETPIT